MSYLNDLQKLRDILVEFRESEAALAAKTGKPRGVHIDNLFEVQNDIEQIEQMIISAGGLSRTPNAVVKLSPV